MISINVVGEQLRRGIAIEQSALEIAACTNADLGVLLRVLARDPNGMCPDVGKLAARVVMGMARLAAQCNEDLEKAVQLEVFALLG